SRSRLCPWLSPASAYLLASPSHTLSLYTLLRLSWPDLLRLLSWKSLYSPVGITGQAGDDQIVSTLYCRLLDVVHAGKFFCQIGIPFALKTALIRPATAWRAFSVFGIQRIHDIHARHHLAERREARLVKPCIVGKINEDLAGAAIGPGSRKSNHAARIAL